MDFIYRQRLRVRYHLSKDAVTKRLAEINRYREIVSVTRKGYYIKHLGILLPARKFDFIFKNKVFDLFLNLPQELKGGKYLIEDCVLFFVFEDLKIEICTQSELYIINEIFVRRCYQFVLPNKESVRMFDVGMNVGLAALFFAGLPFVKSIHAYEPFRQTFLQAKRNFDCNPDRSRKIIPHNFGWGAEEQSVDAYYNYENNGINSIFRPKLHDPIGTIEKLTILPAIDTLVAVLDSFPNDKFVIKIDTEGAEYPIFDSLFAQRLPEQVKGVMLEWHFQGFEHLEDTLLKNGFMLTSFQLDRDSGLIYAFRL